MLLSLKPAFQALPQHSNPSTTRVAHRAQVFQRVSRCNSAVRNNSVQKQMEQPEKQQSSSYSLWLEPEPANPLYGQLVREMDHLATTFNGPRYRWTSGPVVILQGR
eukprot:1158795-Pelagomonas_calceolata.AAC.2